MTTPARTCNPKAILSFTMESIAALRAIFDSCKDMLPDTAILATAEGLFMVNSSSPGCIIAFNIAASDLVNYHCSENITIGLWTASTSKLLKSLHIKDPVTFFVLADDREHLHIEVVSADNEATQSASLPMLDSQMTTSSLTLSEYKVKCTVPTIQLQKLVKDTIAIGAEFIDFIKTPGELRASSKFADCTRDISKKVADSSDIPYTPIHGKYKTAPIKAFVKSTLLSKTIEMSFAEGMPVVLTCNFYRKSNYSFIIWDCREN